MSNWNFVIAAYAVTWIAIGVYAISLARRRAAAEREAQS